MINGYTINFKLKSRLEISLINVWRISCVTYSDCSGTSSNYYLLLKDWRIGAPNITSHNSVGTNIDPSETMYTVKYNGRS